MVMGTSKMGCVQGAQLMSKYGINVPDGAAATTMPEVLKATQDMKDEKGEVRPAIRWTRTSMAM